MFSKLPIFQDPNRNLMLLQTSWTTVLNKALSGDLLNGLLLQDINLKTGNNVINHKLQRKLKGWLVTDQTAASQFFRSADKNDLTLTLNSSADCTVDLYVF